MTKEQVFSFAQQCWPSDRRMWSVDAELPRLIRFAKLVGNAKLEEAAQKCEADHQQAHTYDEDGYSTGQHSDALTCAHEIRSLKEPTP